MKKFLCLILVMVMLFSGCGMFSNEESTTTADNTETTTSASSFAEAEENFTERDKDSTYDTTSSVKITLKGSSAVASSDAVSISGSTITITDEGTYILSGTLNDGMIIVNADEKDKPQLVLEGASINSSTSAPIYIMESDKVFITLAEGTTNTLSNGGEFIAIDDNNIDGAVFSKQDLTFNGTGSLEISSPSGHGIVAKDDLVFTGGSYKISSASHGIDANDSMRTTGAVFEIKSGKDGIHVENTDDTSKGYVYVQDGTLSIEAEGDGISSSAYMQIIDGTFDIISGGGSENGEKQTSDNWGMMGGMHGGMGGKQYGRSQTSTTTTTQTDESSTSIKGIKSGGNMQIDGGSFVINSADDAIHSNASATINGGTFEISSGDDAVHAESTLTISSGKINITESYEGLEALHIELEGGEITLVASDDGLNAAGGTDSSGTTGGRDGMFGGGMPGGMSSTSNGSIVISGGKLNITASGDGIDANGYIKITGGYTIVCGPTQGDTATLDYDSSATISGGTFIGTGASGMAQTFSDSEQGVVAVSVGNQSAGAKIILENGRGKDILTHSPQLSFAVVIISTPDIVKGETYKITVGSTSGEFEAA